MASDYPFANPLSRGSGTPDVTFSCRETRPYPVDSVKKPVYVSESKTEDGDSIFTISPMDDGFVIHRAKTVDFYLSSRTIIAHLLDPAYAFMVEIILLGEIFSLWLELRGTPMIHASATVVDNHAIAFLSTNKGGKSGLAAAFVQQGHEILTDDILPLENRDNMIIGLPGYPAMRMWPDQAGHFLGEYNHLEFVHPDLSKRRIPVGPGGFGSFCNERKPLKAIYLPRRLGPDSGITIEPLSQKNAFFALIQYSFTAGLVELLGLQPQRMEFFSRVAKQVPVRRLNYPDGFHHLPRVVEAVLEDSRSL
jgi:hypothetical protein